jgi:hypothetical protein
LTGMANEFALTEMLGQAALSFRDQTLDVADLVLLGLHGGEWGSFELGVLGLLELEAEHRSLVTAAELRGEATVFRYAHGLVSAADFSGWLRERALTLTDLSGYLRRTLLRARFTETPTPTIGQNELTPVLRAEALCGGVLQRLADAGIRALAAADRLGGGEQVGNTDVRVEATLADALTRTASGLASLGEGELRQRLCRVIGLLDAVARLRHELADEAALARKLFDHQLDWLRLTGTQWRDPPRTNAVSGGVRARSGRELRGGRGG